MLNFVGCMFWLPPFDLSKYTYINLDSAGQPYEYNYHLFFDHYERLFHFNHCGCVTFL